MGEVVIREAVDEDLLEALRLSKDVHQEGSFKDSKFDDKKAALLFFDILNSDNKCFYFAEKDGKLVGFIAGVVDEYFFGPETILSDYSWFVCKELRGTRLGIDLLNRFIEFGDKKNVSEVCIGIATKINLDKTQKVLEGQNFIHMGGTFKLKR